MSDEFLKALGRAGRRERDGADAAVVDAPVLDEAVKERMVAAALDALREGGGSAAKPLPERALPSCVKWWPSARSRRGPVAGATTRRRPLARAGVVSAVLLAASLALFVGLRKDPLPAYSASVREACRSSG